MGTLKLLLVTDRRWMRPLSVARLKLSVIYERAIRYCRGKSA